MRSKTLPLFAAQMLVIALVAIPLSAHSQTITSFDPTGSTSTNPSSINPAGAITGFYTDASFATHGFVRSEDGSFTSFDVSGASGTIPAGINPAGTIMGSYFGTGYVTYAFVRSSHGTITE